MCFFSSPDTPDPPPPPPAPPKQPVAVDPQVRMARDKSKQQQAAAYGQQDTVLTSGLQDEPETERVVLLGRSGPPRGPAR